MPLYEYACEECRHEFEALVFSGDEPECPRCRSRRLERRLSVPARPREAPLPVTGCNSSGPPCGPACGRCLKTCPADAVGHWERDWPACDTCRSPHGFAQLTAHLEKIIHESDAAARKQLLRSEDSFNLWQSILRGAGVVTGCRRCADVCPVGEDYAMLADALEEIPENTPEKERRLAAMIDARPESYEKQKRFIGFLKQV